MKQASAFWHVDTVVQDASIIGWFVVAGYLGAAVACVMAWRSVLAEVGTPSRFWWLPLAAVLVALAVNKELDLHRTVMGWARGWLQPHGWHRLGLAVGAATAVVGVGGALAWLRYRGRFAAGVSAGAGPEMPAALLTLGLLVAMLVVRIDPGPISKVLVIHILSEEDGLWHIHLSELLELVAAIFIVRCAWRFRRQHISSSKQWLAISDGSGEHPGSRRG